MMKPLIYINSKFLLLLFFGLLFTGATPFMVSAQEASFSLSPAKGTYGVRDNFSVNVFISTEGTAINAAQAKISFPPEKLKVVDISNGSSIFTLWVQEPAFSNSKGEISFGGGLPSPGFKGKNGKVITIIFQGKALGEAKVDFGNEIIDANDAFGTNVFSFSQGGVYSISEKILPTEPEAEMPEAGVLEEDNEPPLPFEIMVDNEGDPTNPRPLLYFQTKDLGSGLSHYEIRIDQGDFFSLLKGETNPFRLPFQSPGLHNILVKAFDMVGNYRESTVDVNVGSIASPIITVCPTTFFSGEELLHLEGTSLPSHKIIIFLKKDEKLIRQWETSSNEKGEWYFETDELFKSGIYKISARTQNSKGAVSNPSEDCIFKIVLSGLPIGPWIIDYRYLTLLALLILILLLIIVIYLYWRHRKTKKLIEKEAEDLKNKFYKEYKELQDAIEKEIKEIRKIKTEREFTKEEKEREEKLLKELSDVERVLIKELKDIEEIK